MLILMNLLKQAKKLVTLAISTSLLAACGTAARTPLKDRTYHRADFKFTK